MAPSSRKHPFSSGDASLAQVHLHWDTESSSKAGQGDQAAELSEDLLLCSDSEKATEGRRHPHQNQAEEHGMASELVQTHRTSCPGGADRHVEF